MTIGIGVHCMDGVVLAADRQQTVQGYYKIHERKLENVIWGGATILWTYAYLPSLSRVMRDGMYNKLPGFPPALSSDSIANAIEAQIVEMKTKHSEEMATQEFLYAFSYGGPARFMRVSGGIVDEPEWACIGIGDSSLVNYVFRMICPGPPQIMSTDEALVMAIYMVYLAKQFVDGCGGLTDAVILPTIGRFEYIPPSQISAVESKFGDMQHLFRELYRMLTTEGISRDNLDELLLRLSNSVSGIRGL